MLALSRLLFIIDPESKYCLDKSYIDTSFFQLLIVFRILLSIMSKLIQFACGMLIIDEGFVIT
jgi:hypothetical protein